MSRKDRLARYSFAELFNGKWGEHSSDMEEEGGASQSRRRRMKTKKTPLINWKDINVDEDSDSSVETARNTKKVKQETKKRGEEVSRSSSSLSGHDIKEENSSVKRKGKELKKKIKPCRECSGCKAPDCNKCRNCLDKTKNGGPNLIRQRCSAKICKKEKNQLLSLKEILDSGTKPAKHNFSKKPSEKPFKRVKPVINDDSDDSIDQMLNNGRNNTSSPILNGLRSRSRCSSTSKSRSPSIPTSISPTTPKSRSTSIDKSRSPSRTKSRSPSRIKSRSHSPQRLMSRSSSPQIEKSISPSSSREKSRSPSPTLMNELSEPPCPDDRQSDDDISGLLDDDDDDIPNENIAICNNEHENIIGTKINIKVK